MEAIVIIIIVVLIMSPFALKTGIKTQRAEEEYKQQVIKYKETKDIDKENNFYLENIAKDISSTKSTLKLFLFIYLLPTIIQLILIIQLIIKLN